MNFRIQIVFLGLLSFFLLIIFRLFYFQISLAEKMQALAENQHFIKLELPASRGEILTSDGKPLVTNQPAYLLFAEPKLIENPKEVALKISPILDLEVASVSAKLGNSNLYWAPIKHKVGEEKKKEIEALNLAGLGFEKEGKRFYPEGSMSAHLLGFVASGPDGNDKGYFGIEGYYNEELKGHPGFIYQEKDAQGKPILLGETERIEPANGRSLVLTLDPVIQYLAEKKLKSGIEKYKALGGTVTVINPKTGAILGMASYPAYHPGNYQDFPNSFYKNPVIADSYEPGSIFKIVMMACALDEEVVKPTTVFNESGPIQIGDYKIRTWNDKYHGEINMTQVLEHSSNVGMVYVSQKMGKEKVVSCLKKFGFSEPTGIDLEEEISPNLRPDEEWKPIDLATVSFGQGIAVTRIQMIQAAAAIANGGELIKPFVVKKIIDDKLYELEIAPKIKRRVIEERTARVLAAMMVSAVENGEAKWAKPKGFRIAGKTGTAQIPLKGHYDPHKTIASFVGFAPADEPRFVMLVTLREPTASPWGSETAAPLFFDVARELFTYFGISPE